WGLAPERPGPRAARAGKSRWRLACSSSGRLLPSDGNEPEHVREREDEAAGAGVHAEPDVGGDVDRNQRQARVTGGRIGEVALAGDAVQTGAAEQIDAVDRAPAAVQRQPVLAAELERVV